MSVEWRDGERLVDAFPELSQIASLGLDTPAVSALATDAAATRAYRRIRLQACTCADLLPLTTQDIRDWRSVGDGRLQEIVAFLGTLGNAAPSLAAAAGQLQMAEYVGRHSRTESSDDDAPPAVPGLWTPPSTASPDSLSADAMLTTVASWVRTVTGGATWNDVLAASSLPRPKDVAAAWDQLMASEVDVNGVESAGVIIDEFFAGLNDAGRLVVLERLLGPEKRTLQGLGDQLGVSRERVRQLEVQMADDLRQHLSRDVRWRCVRWAVDILRERLGAFAPITIRSMALPDMSDQARRVITWFAEYRYDDEFLVAAAFAPLTAERLPRIVPGGGVIDEFEVHESLSAAGVREEHAETLLARIPGVTRVDGQLVAWGPSMTDKAAVVLEVRDEPQDVEDLFDLAGGGSLVSFRNRLYEDSRFIRATKSKVALRAWGGSHYTSVTDLMAQRLASGPMEIAELARELHDRYEVSANSVAMYAYAPMFKASGDTVGLRSANDPFVSRNKPYKVCGLYLDGDDKVHWHVRVDQDIVRGSGRPLPQEVATHLGLAAGDEPVELANPVDPVSVSWLPSSIVGPSVGSLRAQAEAAGAALGDTLRLTFTAAPLAVAVEKVAGGSANESPTVRLQRLTGLSQCPIGRAALARAVGVAPSDVVEALEKRGDHSVAVIAAQLADD